MKFVLPMDFHSGWLPSVNISQKELYWGRGPGRPAVGRQVVLVKAKAKGAARGRTKAIYRPDAPKAERLVTGRWAIWRLRWLYWRERRKGGTST